MIGENFAICYTLLANYMAVMDIPTQTALVDSGFEAGNASKQQDTVSNLNRLYYDIPSVTNPADTSPTQHKKHAHHSNYITLDNGSVRKIPTLRATEDENPLHVGALHTASIPSGYFRVLTPILTMRYGAEAFTQLVFGGLQKHDEESGNIFSKVISTVVDGYKNSKIKPLEDFVEKATQQVTVLLDNNASEEAIKEALKQVDGYQAAINTARSLGKPTNAFSFVEKLVKHKIRENEIAHIEEAYNQHVETYNELTQQLNIFKDEFSNTPLADSGDILKNIFSTQQELFELGGLKDSLLKDKTTLDRAGANYSGQISKGMDQLERNLSRTLFDTVVGIASTAGTLFYAHRVYQDIKKVYAEAIAYELYDEGKSASDIKMNDIIQSDNKLVQETWDQFVWKNVWRFATDALFFTRAAVNGLNAVLPDNQTVGLLNYLETAPTGNMMLGAKGILLFTETTRKDTSMLDDLLALVSNKLNPQHGLGEAIKPSELLDLYQKKQLSDDPAKMFKDATRHDVEDDAKWRQASVVFKRVADMMNQTYKYKHRIDIQQSPVEQVEKQILAKYQYFALPKFLYLLGHDLIDVSQPERTLALAEIANQYSIQEVKAFLEEEKSGKTLYELLHERPIDLQKTFGADSTPEMIEISETARSFQRGVINKFLQEHPDIKELYDIIKTYEYTDLSQNLVKPDGSTVSFAQVLEETQGLIDRAHVTFDTSVTFNATQPSVIAANNIVPFRANTVSEEHSQTHPALPKLSFYPADTSSLPKHSNDSHPSEKPGTVIDDAAHDNKIIAKMIAQDQGIAR